jgi:hypothetical protein
MKSANNKESKEEKNMSREEIALAIKEEVEKMTGWDVCVNNVQKNNGVECVALIVRSDDGKASPVIYADEMIEEIISGDVKPREAADKLIRTYEAEKDMAPQINVENLATKEHVLENVVFFVTNEERNSSKKEELPHRDFLDLTAFYRVMINDEENGMAMSYLVKNQHIESIGISEQELYEAAMKNADKEEYSAKSLHEMYAEMLGIPVEAIPLNPIPMYVISNKNGMYGASVLMHTKYIREVADRIGSDLLILPSSIHEVIAVPVGLESIEQLKWMVREVNTSDVSEQEILGDGVYSYSRSEDLLTVA